MRLKAFSLPLETAIFRHPGNSIPEHVLCAIEGMREMWLPLQAGVADGHGSGSRPGGALDVVTAACPLAHCSVSEKMLELDCEFRETCLACGD